MEAVMTKVKEGRAKYRNDHPQRGGYTLRGRGGYRGGYQG